MDDQIPQPLDESRSQTCITPMLLFEIKLSNRMPFATCLMMNKIAMKTQDLFHKISHVKNTRTFEIDLQKRLIATN